MARDSGHRDMLDLALSVSGIIGIWDGDLPGGRVYGDANFARIYGMDPAEVARGKPLGFYYDRMHPDDVGGAVAARDRMMAEGVDFSHEHRIVRPDGSLLWVSARGRLLRDGAGQPVRFIGVSVDITERRLAEARQAFLLELQDALRGLTEPREILTAAATHLGRHLGAARIGYSEVQGDDETLLITNGYVDGVPPVNGIFPLAAFGPHHAATMRAGQTVAYEDVMTDTRGARAFGEKLGTRAHVSVPLVRHGRYTGSLYVTHGRAHRWTAAEIALIEEVAARIWEAAERGRAEARLRASEERLRLLNATLEQQVEERTAELMAAEAALRQSQKMEAVGQLTGGLAHDFNNLLTGISGSLEFIEMRLAQGRVGELDRYVQVALGAAKRAAALTHRLLAFSRRQTLDPKPTDINRLVYGMDELIRRTVSPEVRVAVSGAPGLWAVLADPNQLENALLNLCINARDAMPDGGSVTIETGNCVLGEAEARALELAAGAYVLLSVTDTGLGMTEDVIALAFDPFFTTKPIGEGTGLGLSMVYGFVRQSGGQARIYSEPGCGTKVCLYLPRYLGADMGGEAAADAPGVQRGAGETVLVVDDEPSVRMLVREVLEELGYDALEAEDGASGLRILESGRRVDLLITDVGLPGGMNGRQLADAGLVALPGLKTLFITGYAETAVIGEGQLKPGMHIVTKPFSLDALGRRIKEIIGAG